MIDEIQLCPRGDDDPAPACRLREDVGTAEPFGLTCMSATVPEGLLATVDNPVRGDVVRILPGERTGELAVRLGAERTIRRLDAEPGDYRAIAAAARDRHRAGTLTLVVLNTVEAARAVYRTCAAGRLTAPWCIPGFAAWSGPGWWPRSPGARQTGSSWRPRWWRRAST